jgi:hypothetical protein
MAYHRYIVICGQTPGNVESHSITFYFWDVGNNNRNIHHSVMLGPYIDDFYTPQPTLG